VEEDREGQRKCHLSDSDYHIYETTNFDVYDTTDLDAFSIKEENGSEVEEIMEDEGYLNKDVFKEDLADGEEDGEEIEGETDDEEDDVEWGCAPCPPLPDRRRPFYCPADDHPKTVNRGVLAEWDAWRGRRTSGAALRAPASQPKAQRGGGEEGQFQDGLT